FIDVNVLRGTSGKEVKCNIGYKLIELHVKKATSLHLMCLICIVLMKTNREGGNCWASMLEGENCADEDEQGGNCWASARGRVLVLMKMNREGGNCWSSMHHLREVSHMC
uniref:Uncharacterized protein n=1 Tax=Oncorhynchus tshawytscha TaxID=74940 RepID=A0AAZ3Q655_ONCTS